MSSKRKTDKMLLIFELNGLLGHVNNDPKTVKPQGIYDIPPSFNKDHMSVWYRPHLRAITYELLIQRKK